MNLVPGIQQRLIHKGESNLSPDVYDATKRRLRMAPAKATSRGERIRETASEFWLLADALWHVCKRRAVPIAFALGLTIGYCAHADSGTIAAPTQIAPSDSDRFPVIEDDDVFLTAWNPRDNMAFFLRIEAKLNQDEAEQTAHVLWEAANNAEYATGTDRHLLAWIGLGLSIPEAGGRCGEMSGGYRGLLQIGKLHRGTMRGMGLSYDSEQDCATYGLIKIGKRIAEGRTLHQALTPWAQTRGTALRLYQRAQNHGLMLDKAVAK